MDILLPEILATAAGSELRGRDSLESRRFVLLVTAELARWVVFYINVC